MDEFLNFPGKLTIHCDKVKGIEASRNNVVFIFNDDSPHFIEGVTYDQAMAEWRRAKAARRPYQAESIDTSEVWEALDSTFKAMDNTFRTMNVVFKRTFGERSDVNRKR